ncbi:MAG: ABC transporter permease [Dehalococcoidia bacterium]
MARFVARRLLFMMVTILAVSVIVFSLSQVRGDPRLLLLDDNTSQEQWDAWGKEMGLDRPLPVQYLVWLGKAVKGDFGKSLWEQRPVTESILMRIPATLQLGGASWIFAMALGIPLGVLSAVKRGSFWDYVGRATATFGQALPPFWLGIMLLLFFSFQLNWLPSGRQGGLDHLVLPAITLGWLSAAGMLRLVRSAMLEVLDSEYVKLARCKGVSEWKVIWKHAFRNAVLVPLTYSVLILSGFLTGTVVTETVFSWPGLGRLTVTAINANDFPLMAGTVMFATFFFVAATFLLDLTYVALDRRIRYQ